ncbi:MAG: coenzyme F420-0:L-glutamate ligase [Proteobacteria bacterium]|nr:coenzyme F420-0:L-glutamate ligase [Pseudomonadota bacterium]
MSAPALTLTAIPDLPLIEPGDDLAAILIDGLARAGIAPAARDVLVVAQKVVSKAENRYRDLGAVTPSDRARDLARAVDKDPRLVEVILSESEAVVAHKPGVLVVAHRLGFVLANAGVDRSNVKSEPGAERVLLLPEDPDASAAALKARLDAHFETEIAVIVSDSLGRAWRNGVTGIALGAAGLPALRDMIGRKDLFGRTLDVTQTGFAEDIAGAASLLMGQADEGLPAVLLRGLAWHEPPSNARALLRPKDEDLFR